MPALTDTNSTLDEIARNLGRCTRRDLAGNHRNTEQIAAFAAHIHTGAGTPALPGNHRNTEQIAAFAAHFHTGAGTPALPGRQGPPPRLHRFHERGAAETC